MTEELIFVNNMTPGQDVNTLTCLLLWTWHKNEKNTEKEKKVSFVYLEQ